MRDYDCGMIAAGALLKYLYETQKNDLNNISVIHPYSTGKYMIIDSSDQKESGAGGDAAREAETRIAPVGA